MERDSSSGPGTSTTTTASREKGVWGKPPHPLRALTSVRQVVLSVEDDTMINPTESKVGFKRGDRVRSLQEKYRPFPHWSDVGTVVEDNTGFGDIEQRLVVQFTNGTLTISMTIPISGLAPCEGGFQ